MSMEHGDYDLRAPDYDTQLIGPITDSIIDADRLARRNCPEVFPLWEMYRVAYAGDDLYAPALRSWCVGFADAYCRAGGVRRDAYSEELACWVGWDAYTLLAKGAAVRSQALPAVTEIADMMGVHKTTYRRLRDVIYRVLLAALHDYWAELGIAIRLVRQREREVPNEKISDNIVLDGVYKGAPIISHSDGNYRIMPSPNPDNS